MSDPDYSKFLEKPDGNILERIAKKAHEQLQAELAMAEAEEELKRRKDALARISQKELPELMEEAQQLRVTTADKLEVVLEESVHGSIPVANRDAAVEWLDEHDHSNLVDRVYEIRFGREDDAWARKFERDMQRRKRQLPCRRVVGVNPSRLKGFVREALRNGVQLPLELFGIHRRKETKVKLPKRKIF